MGELVHKQFQLIDTKKRNPTEIRKYEMERKKQRLLNLPPFASYQQKLVSSVVQEQLLVKIVREVLLLLASALSAFLPFVVLFVN